MFEWLFNLPWTAFSRGSFVLLSGWPAWLLALSAAFIAGVTALSVLRVRTARRAVLWGLQATFLCLLLLMLWRPAVSVSSLKPHANIIAILVDDSRSMSIREDGRTRIERAKSLLGGGLVSGMSQRFQVRTYRFAGSAERIEDPQTLQGAGNASRIGEALDRLSADAAGLPIGAVVLLSDGGDNTGGVDRDTMNRLRRRRIPVHTVGFGRERAAHDVEIAGATTPARVLPGSRVTAAIALRSAGYAGSKARLTVRDAGRLLASREVTLKSAEQNESLTFSAGAAGARVLEISVDPLAGEENTANNRVTRLLAVESRMPRILYVEGEPRWEYKFLRRALEEDQAVQVVTILRTTQNKIYRQGIKGPTELEQGFPSVFADLFQFDGLILGSVESGWFTQSQQEAIRLFASQRGGGVLFLGGRSALGEGGYGAGGLAEMLPVDLPNRRGTFKREPATVRLTDAGKESPLLRLLESPEANAARWQTMPPLADHQEIGSAKPGATVLAEMDAGGRRLPLLVLQRYGRGRSGVLATGGTWRWQMRQDHADTTHETFWRQVLRWLVSDTPGPVELATPRQVLADETRVPLRADVRNKEYRPVPDAEIEARIVGPGGEAAAVEFTPKIGEAGVFTADASAVPAGQYLIEVVARRAGEELGRDVVAVRREDGTAENFRTEQNRELLERLSEQTGGRYYRPSEASKLAREIEYSEAGIAVREVRDLWSMPALLILALAVRSAEWLLRRRWGSV